jgi:hypothetical protein
MLSTPISDIAVSFKSLPSISEWVVGLTIEVAVTAVLLKLKVFVFFLMLSYFSSRHKKPTLETFIIPGPGGRGLREY